MNDLLNASSGFSLLASPTAAGEMPVDHVALTIDGIDFSATLDSVSLAAAQDGVSWSITQDGVSFVAALSEIP